METTQNTNTERGDVRSIDCSAFDLGRLAELDKRRIEAEREWQSAHDEAGRWQNEAGRRWFVAEKLGNEWIALKRELGLLPNAEVCQPEGGKKS